MNHKVNSIFILLSGLPVFLISYWVINSYFSSECSGMAHLIFRFLGIIAAIIGALIVMFYHIIRMTNKPKSTFRITTMVMVIGSVISIPLFIQLPKDYFKSDSLLEAEFYKSWGGNIKLRKDGSYTALHSHIDWSCIYEGEYSEEGNMIILNEQLVQDTDSTFAKKYLLMEPYLIPAHEFQTNTDSSRWLKIVKNNL